MIVLAIETSCDETGVAIVESKGAFTHRIMVNLLASQIKLHSKYGGVVPGLAAREHVKNLPLLVKEALKRYGGTQFDAIAYTDHPGLEPALLVGRTFAKTFGYALNIPTYPINHLYGHIFANFIKKFQVSSSTFQELFPAIALVISGGHTQLYLMKSFQQIELLGETVDDAVGEAFDKGARLLGLSYPGGPALEQLAAKGQRGIFTFPSPMIRSPNFQFSFSGLKTALLYKLQNIEKESKLTFQKKAHVAYAYQHAAFGVLREKTKRALFDYHARSFFIGGGVAANQIIREMFDTLCATNVPPIYYFVPEKQFCTDNAVMIALAYTVPLLTSDKIGKK